MTKLIIDERDLRCTMLEVVRELLGEHHENAETIAKNLGDRVVALGDKPSPKTTLDQLEQMLGQMMTMTMRASARAQMLVEMLALVNGLRVEAKCPRVHTDCFRMPGGTAPCACLDGCGACDSCGKWLGEIKHALRVDRRGTTLLGCSCGFECGDADRLTAHMTEAAARGESTVLDNEAETHEPHAFVRGDGSLGPPDETCQVCQCDPRNIIHRRS